MIVRIRIVRGKLSASIVSLHISTPKTKGISKSFFVSFVKAFVQRYVLPAVNCKSQLCCSKLVFET